MLRSMFSERLTSSWNIIRSTDVSFFSTNRTQSYYTAWLNLRVFKPLACALSAVFVDVENLFPIKKRVLFPNHRPLFLAETRTLGQIVNLRRHVDFHDSRHVVVLGTWGEPVVNTTPGPFIPITYRIGLGMSVQYQVHRERRGWVLLPPYDEVRRERCGGVSWLGCGLAFEKATKGVQGIVCFCFLFCNLTTYRVPLFGKVAKKRRLRFLFLETKTCSMCESPPRSSWRQTTSGGCQKSPKTARKHHQHAQDLFFTLDVPRKILPGQNAAIIGQFGPALTRFLLTVASPVATPRANQPALICQRHLAFPFHRESTSLPVLQSLWPPQLCICPPEPTIRLWYACLA